MRRIANLDSPEDNVAVEEITDSFTNAYLIEYISRIAVAMNYSINADEMEIELNKFSLESEDIEIEVDITYCGDGGYVFNIVGYGDFVINGKEALGVEPEFIGKELAKIALGETASKSAKELLGGFKYYEFHQKGDLHRNVLLNTLEDDYGITFRNYDLSTTGIKAKNNKTEKILKKLFS